MLEATTGRVKLGLSCLHTYKNYKYTHFVFKPLYGHCDSKLE